MRVAGIQPGYLPWLGHFDQMLAVDTFIVADELPFSPSGWAHRNRVLGPNGPVWLRLPVRPKRGQRICDVRLDPRVPWRRSLLRTLRQSYARSPWAAEEIERLEPLLDQSAALLVDVTLPLLRHLVDRLAIVTPIVVSSEVGLDARFLASAPPSPTATDRIVGYLQGVGANALLEGASGRAFIDLERCAAAGIDVTFHDYEHPVYEQIHGPFVSHLSVVDLLLNVGAERARDVLTRAVRGVT